MCIRDRGSAVGLRLCVAAARPQSCPKNCPPRGPETPPPFRGDGGLFLKRPCVGARCREYWFGPLPLAPNGPGQAFPGRESHRKIRKPTFRIDHFRGSLFSRKKGPRRAWPAAPCLLAFVARVYGAVRVLLHVYILCRPGGGQGLCRADTVQPRGRAVRPGLGKSSSLKPSPSPTGAREAFDA